MERAQARMLLQECIPRSSEVVLDHGNFSNRPGRGCATRKQPRPTIFQKARTPPTGTLWAPHMHSSRSALHACSSSGLALGSQKAENGRQKPMPMN